MAFDQSAALPFRVSAVRQLEILLITSRNRGRWIIPKGGVEPNLTPHASAAKEAWEEAGVRGAISAMEIGSYWHQKIATNGAVKQLQVVVYPLAVDYVSDQWDDMTIRRRNWFAPAEAIQIVDEAGLREIIADFVALPGGNGS